MEEQKTEEAKPDMISQANMAAERIELANKKQEELLLRQERLQAEARLGGKTQAGQAPEKPKEQTAQEYAKDVLNCKVNPLAI